MVNTEGIDLSKPPPVGGKLLTRAAPWHEVPYHPDGSTFFLSNCLVEVVQIQFNHCKMKNN